MLVLLLVDSLRFPYDFVWFFDAVSKLRNSLYLLKCSAELIYFYNLQ